MRRNKKVHSCDKHHVDGVERGAFIGLHSSVSILSGTSVEPMPNLPSFILTQVPQSSLHNFKNYEFVFKKRILQLWSCKLVSFCV